uniref:Uncharacterized protein n=1 Tax=Arundo donax TaxID=35708 RepID=A0A0A9EU25_ARUDO
MAFPNKTRKKSFQKKQRNPADSGAGAAFQEKTPSNSKFPPRGARAPHAAGAPEAEPAAKLPSKRGRTRLGESPRRSSRVSLDTASKPPEEPP